MLLYLSKIVYDSIHLRMAGVGDQPQAIPFNRDNFVFPAIVVTLKTGRNASWRDLQEASVSGKSGSNSNNASLLFFSLRFYV